jgi:hypothetical protein
MRNATNIHDDLHRQRRTWLIYLGRFFVAKDNIQNLVETAAIVLMIVGFSGKVYLIADARDIGDLLQRNKIDSNPRINVIELHTPHAYGAILSFFFCIFVKAIGSHRQNWNANKCNDVGEKTDRVRPNERHESKVTVGWAKWRGGNILPDPVESAYRATSTNMAFNCDLTPTVVIVEVAIMANKGSQTALGATDSGLRASDYPLGSGRSRAAARALLDARRAAQGEGTLICVKSIVKSDDPDLKCTCPIPEAGTFALCECFR